MNIIVKARRGLLQRGDRETIESLISCFFSPEQHIRDAAVRITSSSLIFDKLHCYDKMFVNCLLLDFEKPFFFESTNFRLQL